MKRPLLLLALLIMLASFFTAIAVGQGSPKEIAPLYFGAGISYTQFSHIPEEFSPYFRREGPKNPYARRRTHELTLRRDQNSARTQCSSRDQCAENFDESGSLLIWAAPYEREYLTGFQIAWRTGKKWKERNTAYVSVDDDQEGSISLETSKWILLPSTDTENAASFALDQLPNSIIIKPGESLRIRVKALYSKGKDGRWSDVLVVPHPAIGCGSKNKRWHLRLPNSPGAHCVRKYG